ncbi:MAG: flagellar protein FlaG [Candidatus Latescibacteria bacterium]|jgi:flagellar protein FlaG|nr:flagellar protein FlaG [Candidatus Latescibacterota bacterium]
MEFAIQATRPTQLPAERVHIKDSPSSTQQDVAVESTERNAPPIQRVEDVQKLEKAAERLNKALDAFDRDLNISFHDDGQVVVRVTDPKTGEVIRQIPPERVLEVAESLDKIVGLFLDDTA